tara:strand:- start:1817 stop:2149 length:333 start_codon:yes stop_codon:yes gene_type:complete
MPNESCKIKIGDLVKVKKSFLFPEQDVFILPYDKDSVGLVIKIEDAGYIYDSDIGPVVTQGEYDTDVKVSSMFGKYITVKWSGCNKILGIDDSYVHLDDELEIISKVREK